MEAIGILSSNSPMDGCSGTSTAVVCSNHWLWVNSCICLPLHARSCKCNEVWATNARSFYSLHPMVWPNDESQGGVLLGQQQKQLWKDNFSSVFHAVVYLSHFAVLGSTCFFFVLHLLHFAPGCPTMRLARPSCIKIMKRCKALWTIGLDVDHWFMTTQTISLGAVTSDKGSQSSFATAANRREKSCKCICFQLFTWNTNHAAHSAWKLEAFICCWQHIFSTQCFSDMKSASLYP